MMNYYTDNPVLRHYLNHPLFRRIVEMRERNFAEAEKYDYAPVDFEEAVAGYEQVLTLVGELCAEVVAPNAATVDTTGPTLKEGRVEYAPASEENMQMFRKAGLMGISIPRQYGGLNFPTTIFTMLEDLVARADAGFGNLWGLQECAETINSFGTEEQRERYLPRIASGETMSMDLTEPDAGSDLQSVRLKATYNEAEGRWYLNGVKRFITNGDADIHLVLARSEEGSSDGRGLSLFIYDKRNGGVHTRRIEDKMGIHGSPTCELVYNNAPAELCGSRKMGLIKYVMALMNSARIGIATQSVGLSEAAYSEAVGYADNRKQFGREIKNFAPVYEMLGEMKARLDASRSLLYATARNVDMTSCFEILARERSLTPEERQEAKAFSRVADALTPIVKGMGSEICNRNAYDSIQVHGGSGYMKDYTCERLYRDARITSIYEGTTQLQVVAAIRYATNGFYSTLLDEYLAEEVSPAMAPVRERIVKMAEIYRTAVARAQSFGCQETNDFLSRRIYEMASYCIMSALLMLDASANEELFASSARRFTAMSEAIVAAHATFIENYTPEVLNDYRSC
ncbi:MAG: acyl-CoA dehydrogenase family protein [Bacteroidaceae bacterium]|nr:acyl-CoA dehydrogenase family protein [Bacteroidaceae bacterium]